MAFNFPASPVADQVYSPAGGPTYVWKSNRWMVDQSIINVNGILFPDTQVNSADVNTLDDYEEGAWTPSYGCSTGALGAITYDAANRYGQYTKIGRQVFVQWRIATTALAVGTASGAVYVTGLPFTHAAFNHVGVDIAYSVGFTTNNPTSALIQPSVSVIYLYYRASAVAVSGAFAPSNLTLTAGNGIIGFASYVAA